MNHEWKNIFPPYDPRTKNNSSRRKPRTKEHLENITDRRDLDVTFEGLIILAKRRTWRGWLKGKDRSTLQFERYSNTIVPNWGIIVFMNVSSGRGGARERAGEPAVPSRGCQNLSTARWKVECAENTRVIIR